MSCRYYSMYGHVEKLAEEIQKGAESVEGVEAKLWQVSFLLNLWWSVTHQHKFLLIVLGCVDRSRKRYPKMSWERWAPHRRVKCQSLLLMSFRRPMGSSSASRPGSGWWLHSSRHSWTRLEACGGHKRLLASLLGFSLPPDRRAAAKRPPREQTTLILSFVIWIYPI